MMQLSGSKIQGRNAYLSRAWFHQRICKFCLKMQKKLWICLILLKNLYLKYRFFALFRRVSWFMAHLARNPCSRNRSCERNRKLTEGWFASSSFPSLFALVISVDKLFEMLVLFFVELLNLFAEVWIFRRNELVLASLWICVVKQDRFKEM